MVSRDSLCAECKHPKYLHLKNRNCFHGYENWMEMAIRSHKNGKPVDEDWCSCKQFEIRKERVK